MVYSILVGRFTNTISAFMVIGRVLKEKIAIFVVNLRILPQIRAEYDPI